MISLLHYYGWKKFSIIYEEAFTTVAKSLTEQAKSKNMTINHFQQVIDNHKCCEKNLACCRSSYWHQVSAFIGSISNYFRHTDDQMSDIGIELPMWKYYLTLALSRLIWEVFDSQKNQLQLISVELSQLEILRAKKVSGCSKTAAPIEKKKNETFAPDLVPNHGDPPNRFPRRRFSKLTSSAPFFPFVWGVLAYPAKGSQLGGLRRWGDSL